MSIIEFINNYKNNYWYKKPEAVIFMGIYEYNYAHNCIPAAIPMAFIDGFLSLP